MNDLFLTEPEFAKESAARKYLGQDHSTWVKEIITDFLSEYPMLQNEPLTVLWEKTNFDKGYATGKLNLPSTGVTIPLIIKEWVLYPMDIINISGTFLPLNKFTAEEIFLSKQPFIMARNNKPKTELTLFSEGKFMQFSPTGESSPASYSDGNSQTRDAVKVAFIENITNVNPKELELLLNSVTDTTIALMEKNKTIEVIDSLNEVKLASSNNKIEEFVRELDIDISYVYEDNVGNKILKQANSNIDYVWETDVTEDDLDELKIKAVENEIDTFKKAEYTYIEVEKDIFEIGDTGYFKLNDKKTPKDIIVNITKTASNSESYNVYKIIDSDNYITIDKNINYSIIDKHLDKTAELIELEGIDPKIGDTGIFILNGISTKPFEVISFYKSAKAGEYEIIGYEGLTKVGYYPIKSTSQEFIPLTKIANYVNKAYYVPGQAKFVKLSNNLNKSLELTEKTILNKLASSSYGELKVETKNNIYHISKDVVDITRVNDNEHIIPITASFVTTEKIASLRDIPKQKNIAGRDSAGLFYFNGQGFNKYAHSLRDLSKDEAVWTLLHCKGNEADIRKLSSLNKNENLELTSNIIPPISIEELSNEIQDNLTITKNAEFFKDLVKLAAVLQDSATVDAVLSLGLLNDKNALEYVAMLPNYEIVLSELSELLVMIRLGLSGINEQAVSETINALSEVVKGLKEIKGITNLK